MPSVSCLIFFLFSGAVLVGQDFTSRSGDGKESRLSWLHRGFDFQAFRDFDPCSQPIDFDNVDFALLSAAVFHETNRRRAIRGIPVLRFREGVREASLIQAHGMARMGHISHQHPDESLRMLKDRLKRVGLRGFFRGENVAKTFGIRYRAGEPVIPREENDRTLFSYEAGGDPIPPHTYLSFATALVDSWMESPGHRENILRKTPEELGTGHVIVRNEIGMPVVYSVQVFFVGFDLPR